jgi:D-alanyl-D-alanine dipeptidase
VRRGEDTADARRAYWRAQMDEAYAFMLRCRRVPIAENGEPLAALRDSASDAGVEVVFSERPHVGGRERIYALREALIAPFVEAARAFNSIGLVMKVEDGYRSLEMQRGLATEPSVLGPILRSVLEETGGVVPSADLMFRRVSALVATRPRVATHMSGSAIDISVVDRSGREIDRGGPYLEMSARTPMGSPFVSTSQARARKEITDIMARHGFVAYPYEFWHYNAGDVFAACIEGRRSARYGPVSFEPSSPHLTPLHDQDEPLVTPSELSEAIEGALG